MAQRQVGHNPPGRAMVDWYACPRDPTTIRHDWMVFDPRPEAMPIQDHIEYLRDALNQHRGPGAAELALRCGRGHPNGVDLRHAFRPAEGIKDHDVVYFDTVDLSADAEKRLEQVPMPAWLALRPGLGSTLQFPGGSCVA